MRNYSVDLLRVLCCFLVVWIHTAPMYTAYLSINVTPFQGALSLLIECFVRVGLPVFFVISGMFILNQNIGNIFSFYKKRLISISVPFIIFSILHYLISSYWNHTSPSITDYASRLTNTTAISIHFWFVYAIIGLYIVSPFFAFMIRQLDSRQAWVGLGVLTFMLIYNVYLSHLITGIVMPEFSVWLVYFIAGGLITKVTLPRKIIILLLVVGYASTVLASYLNVNNVFSFSLKPYENGLNMFVFTMALVCLFTHFNFTPGKAVSKILLFISANTYSLYLIHIASLMTVTKFIPGWWIYNNVFSYTFGISLLTFLTALIISVIVNKLIVNKAISLLS